MDQTLYAILTLAAIVIGPISAVLITRWLDDRSEAKRRRFELFKDLMQTRGIRLDPVHVAALNIVELEFYDKQAVRAAFQKYIEHLSAPEPNSSDEDLNRHYDHRSDLFMDLVHQIGIVVGYNFDKRELERRSYVPKGWNDENFIQRKNAVLLNQLLEGHRPLPVSNFIAQNSPFPEPPELEHSE
ncbi:MULTISPECIES: DUF6680 family protein [unclassified Ruegeria]|uniref:DUF6680 family protein n=1 Tax=unclassified Ruegeria TaxID=2625375 RepID=UPI0014876CDB|nr:MULTISPECIES: DUF6680 family protein [unclassified Ruegeria]